MAVAVRAPYEKQIFEGWRGAPEYGFTLYRSDQNASKLEALTTTIDSLSFSINNFRDHTWEIDLPMRAASELDVFADYVFLEVTVSAGDYEIVRPFGLYFFEVPEGEDSPMAEHWHLTGRSPEALLMGSTAQFGYAVAAGTGVLAAVRTILTTPGLATPQGFPARRIHFPPNEDDVFLPRRFFADPFVNSEDVRWLRICNHLLAAGGFYALYTDNEGRFATKKIPGSDRLETDMTYGSVPDSDRLITSETIAYAYDDENFANRVVVMSGDPQQAASIAFAENRDPNSRVSFLALGRWVRRDPIVLPKFVSASEAQLVANAALRRASGMNFTRSFETVFDTRISPRQVYGLEVFGDDGRTIESGKEWPAVNVECTLDNSAVASMSHEVHHGVRL